MIPTFGSDGPSAPVIPPLLISVPVEALVRLVTEQLQYREQLLEETRGDLEVTKSELAAHKKALYDASREMDDLRERFEQERRALNDEILRLEVRRFLHQRQNIVCCFFGPSPL